MKDAFIKLFLAGILAIMPLAASAAMSDAEAQSMVKTMVEEVRPASDIITALMSDGRGLIDATIFALVAGGESYRTEFAKAGITMAKSLHEAEAVAYALLATAGQSGQVAATVDNALRAYKSSISPPLSYQGCCVATGGDVSPSN